MSYCTSGFFLRAVDKAVIVCHPPIRVDFTTSPRICLARMLRYDVPAGCMGISQSLVADRVYTDPGMSYRLRRPVAIFRLCFATSRQDASPSLLSRNKSLYLSLCKCSRARAAAAGSRPRIVRDRRTHT